MNKRFGILLSLAALPTLALWLRAADPVGDPAREAFEHGNVLLRDARKACALHEPDLLRQAAGQYRDCLKCPANSLAAGTLFTAARHNLELTKLLLAQAVAPEKANGGGDQKAGPNEAKKETRANQGSADDPFSPANRKDTPAKADEANAKEGTSAKPDALKDSAGWNDQPRRDAGKRAEKSPAHETHPFDSQCPT